MIDTFQRHSYHHPYNHRLIHVSTPTAFLCGWIKKKDLHLCKYPSMQAQKGIISSGGAETFSSVIIHIFLLPHFNPNTFLHFYSGEITARNEFSFFLAYAAARVWRPLIRVLIDSRFPSGTGKMKQPKIQVAIFEQSVW